MKRAILLGVITAYAVTRSSPCAAQLWSSFSFETQVSASAIGRTVIEQQEQHGISEGERSAYRYTEYSVTGDPPWSAIAKAWAEIQWDIRGLSGRIYNYVEYSQLLGSDPAAQATTTWWLRAQAAEDLHVEVIDSQGQLQSVDVPIGGIFGSETAHITYVTTAIFPHGPMEKRTSTFLYAVNGTPFPGQTQQNPLPSESAVPIDKAIIDGIVGGNVYEDSGANPPVNIAGSFLTSLTPVPVVDNGYGQTDTVYIDPALAIGYGYTLQDTNRFHTYQIPAALPQGDDTFEIHYAGVAYPLTAGEVFDFTTIEPLGVDSFLLLGIDETELITAIGNTHAPFVYGATFMEPGLAEVTSFPLFVPEPADFNRDALVDGRDFLAWQRGESPDPLSSADLALWQASYGADSSLTGAVAVPEPAGFATMLMVSMTLLLKPPITRPL